MKHYSKNIELDHLLNQPVFLLYQSNNTVAVVQKGETGYSDNMYTLPNMSSASMSQKINILENVVKHICMPKPVLESFITKGYDIRFIRKYTGGAVTNLYNVCHGKQSYNTNSTAKGIILDDLKSKVRHRFMILVCGSFLRYIIVQLTPDHQCFKISHFSIPLFIYSIHNVYDSGSNYYDQQQKFYLNIKKSTCSKSEIKLFKTYMGEAQSMKKSSPKTPMAKSVFHIYKKYPNFRIMTVSQFERKYDNRNYKSSSKTPHHASNDSVSDNHEIHQSAKAYPVLNYNYLHAVTTILENTKALAFQEIHNQTRSYNASYNTSIVLRMISNHLDDLSRLLSMHITDNSYLNLIYQILKKANHNLLAQVSNGQAYNRLNEVRGTLSDVSVILDVVFADKK